MTEHSEKKPSPKDDGIDYPAEQELDGVRDVGDDANALRFTEEESLIQAELRRLREERARKKAAEEKE